jgi:hypothetical protein
MRIDHTLEVRSWKMSMKRGKDVFDRGLRGWAQIKDLRFASALIRAICD